MNSKLSIQIYQFKNIDNIINSKDINMIYYIYTNPKIERENIDMKIIKIIIKGVIIIILLAIIINVYMVYSTKNKIIDIASLPTDVDCILVLGAGVRSNSPSPMLEDRLLTGKQIYENNLSEKILVSGDHTKEDYDEVNVMKTYLIENGIGSKDIFMDHAGISSYDSIYRAKNIFKAKKIVIVTQEYHLYRALYIANQLDIDAYGVIANKRDYYGQTKRDIREYLARVKDFFKCIFKPKSKYLGEVFNIKGNGDGTNDKQLIIKN